MNGKIKKQMQCFIYLCLPLHNIVLDSVPWQTFKYEKMPFNIFYIIYLLLSNEWQNCSLDKLASGVT